MVKTNQLLYFIFFLFFVLGCNNDEVSDTPDKPVVKTTKLRVLTYNIFGAREGGVSASDLTEIANVIKRINPHLVALQEVDVNTKRTGVDRNIAKELAELCGMEYFFAKAMNFDGGEYGDAVLSKLPVKATKAYNMSILPAYGGELRSVAQIKIEINNREMYFMSTHLDHKYEENRKYQSNQLLKILESLDLPYIIGGDFNAEPDAESVKILYDKLNFACQQNCKQYKTFPATKPNTTIDYIMSSKSPDLTVDYYGVESWATTQSDHLPVYAIYNVITISP